VDIADETFLVADRAELADRFADPALWQSWWPELELSVSEARGKAGICWQVRGRLVGTAEIWLEPWHDGVIVHWFVRARLGSGDTKSLRDSMIRVHKRRIHQLKDELERTRAPGTPRDRASG
jgi:hypothetical protein